MAVLKIQLGDLCELLDVDQREVRYILEQGHVPKGVEENPKTGNWREFGPDHAFWLAIVVKLKQAGMKMPLAAQIADVVKQGMLRMSQNLSWDPTFLPMRGWFETDHQHFVDIGDLEFIRLVTDANPSHEGLYEFPWQPIARRGIFDTEFRPFVVHLIDITHIASLLAEVKGWKCPRRTPHTGLSPSKKSN
jgi:hypothetical protein